MPTLTMNPTLGDLLKREHSRDFNREVGTLLSGQNLKIGAMLGRVEVDTSAVVVAAAATNTAGSGALTADATTPVLAGAQVGVYTVVCVEPGTNVGTFAVYDPQGVFIGRYVVGGSAFATQIKFAIADATDFVSGDHFTVTVAAGSGKYKQLAYSAQADGSHRWAGVLLEDKDASSADASVVVLRRGPAIVAADRLVWHADFDSAGKKATPLAAMTAAGIVPATTA